MAAVDFREALSGGCSSDDIIGQLINLLDIPARESFWLKHTNNVMLYLQGEVDSGYHEAEEA